MLERLFGRRAGQSASTRDEPSRRQTPATVPPGGAGTSAAADPLPANNALTTTGAAHARRIPRVLRALLGNLGRIALGRNGLFQTAAPASEIAPGLVADGGRFLAGSYTNFAGMRQYRLYVPGAYRGQPLPLIVMLHGCQQSPEDFAAGTRMNLIAEAHACFVVYPGQPKYANGSKCWNWFSPRHQHRGRGEPSIIAGISRRIMSEYAVDKRRVYVAGLSAGGAAAAVLAATYPDLYAAAGVHSGLARGAARNVPTAFAAMQHGHAIIPDLSPLSPGPGGMRAVIPTIVFHGDRDDTVHLRNGEQVITQAGIPGNGELRPVVKQGRAQDGHRYSQTLYRDAAGKTVLEMWVVHGSGHAWSGGSAAGSYTDPLGPDASQEMLRFFLDHPLPPG